VTRPSLRFVALCMLVAALVVAPSHPDQQVSSRAIAHTTASLSESDAAFLDEDHQLAKLLSEEEPTLGNYYVENGTLFLRLTEATQARQESAISAIRRRNPKLGWLRVQRSKADYSFQELVEWHDRMIMGYTLELPGVAFTDVGWRKNRLTVAVESVAAHETAVRARVDELGIPQAAVDVIERQRNELILRQERRPLVGGLQIKYDLGGFETSGACTLGALASRSGVRGFVTAAHCSQNKNQVNSEAYWQPEHDFFDEIGHETVDPPLRVLSNCPANRLCRYSDANFVAKENGITTTSQVAKVSYGTTTWNGTSYWRITSRRTVTVEDEGLVVTKLGRTTGRTSGSIIEACRAEQVENYYLLCQFTAGTAADYGDSGAPVFIITNYPAVNDIAAVGIVWGSPPGIGINDSWTFSPWREIRQDLGAMEICYVSGGFSC
jgi:hypothetical protein